MSRIIKSQSVGISLKEAKSIPFLPLDFSEPHLNDSLQWTVDQAKKESTQLIADAQKRSQLIIKQAEDRAAELSSQIQQQQLGWEEERTLLQQDAYEKAFQLGHEEGREKGYSDLSSAIEEAKQMIAASKEAFEDHINNSEQVILQIAMKSTEKILAQVLEDKPERFLEVVKKGIKEAREMKEVKVYVALQQFTLVQQEREELRAIFPVDVQLYIYPEEELAPYQCFIESNQGRIDVSVDAQLTQMKRKLSDLLGDE
ncbi:flagellar assembly protein FliH [Jeotgalibacillus soli]|uniref:Flagellar assembly protein FliH n=1 Tax=Jeotgalibacillus soli TaxID=889306 RepID=A0A0C2R3P7_9BACL|nr:flagellar assembly protein FliH [Jeotgalibacillus soli]KIL44885.1 hypothetical protein KP78_24290 [Jeotgalibacillus soli]